MDCYLPKKNEKNKPPSGWEHMLYLQTSDRLFLLCAKTLDDRNMWMAGLRYLLASTVTVQAIMKDNNKKLEEQINRKTELILKQKMGQKKKSACPVPSKELKPVSDVLLDAKKAGFNERETSVKKRGRMKADEDDAAEVIQPKGNLMRKKADQAEVEMKRAHTEMRQYTQNYIDNKPASIREKLQQIQREKERLQKVRDESMTKLNNLKMEDFEEDEEEKVIQAYQQPKPPKKGNLFN